jgi:flagellar protein FlbD
MIKVTRLNNSTFWVNADMIEFVEATPDTVISLISGNKIIVLEPADTIIEAVITYRKKVGYRPVVVEGDD